MSLKKRKSAIKSLAWEEIFASLGDGLIILNTELQVTGINPAAERITGFSGESILGLGLSQAFPRNEEVLQRLHRSFEETGVVTLRDVPWAGRYGDRLTVDISSMPLMGDGGDLNGWILLCRDITPLKSLEEGIRKSDRLAMIGTLAAGLAHEIKNPLGGIRGAAQLLFRENVSSDAAECLKIIIREVDRVDKLVTQLLTFSRPCPKTLTLVPVNLNELLDSVLLLQKTALEEKEIRVIRGFDPSLPSIHGNAESLSQVFLNLIKNAMEALPETGGQIVVQSRMITDYRIKGEKGEKASRMVVAEIRDNGMGIPKENLENIFTPFFTTKEKGCGLGLAVSQRIVSEHRGFIQVKSEGGAGTAFRVFLRAHV